MKLPNLPGVQLSGVQVSLHRLIKLLQIKGRNPGFDISSAVVPVVDVTSLIESEGDGTLATDDPGFLGYGVGTSNGVDRRAIVQLSNRSVDTDLEVTSIRTNYLSGQTFTLSRLAAECDTAAIQPGASLFLTRAGPRSGIVRTNETAGGGPARTTIHAEAFQPANAAMFEWLDAGKLIIPPGSNVAVHMNNFFGGSVMITWFRWFERPRR